MNPKLTIDSREFSKAVRDYSIESKRELSLELNKRMFYLLLRVFVLMEPRFVRAAKAKAKSYLEAVKPRLLAPGAKPRKSSKLLY